MPSPASAPLLPLRIAIPRSRFLSSIPGAVLLLIVGIRDRAHRSTSFEHELGTALIVVSIAVVVVAILRCFFPRTVLTETGVVQRTLFRTHRVEYRQIGRVRPRLGGVFHATHIYTKTGEQLRITGTIDQLTRAEQILRERTTSQMPATLSN